MIFPRTTAWPAEGNGLDRLQIEIASAQLNVLQTGAL